MKRKNVLLSCLLSFAMPLAAQTSAPDQPRQPWPQEPASFLGIRFGLPISASVAPCPKDLRGSNPCFVDAGGGQFVVINKQVGEVSFATVSVNELNGKVAYISGDFGSDKSPAVSEALIEKFGNPHTESNVTVRTRAGVPYNQHIARWTGVNVSLLFKSVDESANNASVTAMTPAYHDKLVLESKQNSKSLANSF